MKGSLSVRIKMGFAVFVMLLTKFAAVADETVNAPKPDVAVQAINRTVEETDQNPEEELSSSVEIGSVVVVETGDDLRIDSPVSIELSLSDNSKEVSAVRLVEITGGIERMIPSQIEISKPRRLWWIVDGTTPPHTKRRYRIQADLPHKNERESATTVQVDRKSDFVEFQIGPRPVLRYNSSHIEVTEKVDPAYGRSAFIHPAWTPKGAVVTDQFPPDHAHQSGIFLANVKTEFEGRSPDFWNLLGKTGRVRFKELKSVLPGSVFGELTVDHEHVDLSAESEKVAMYETWWIRVWNLNQTEPTYWVCDITSKLMCASASPVHFKQYHYGGMALRGARAWTPGNCQFLTSDGHDRLAGNHSRPRWCDLSGDVDGRLVGITFLSQANNFGFPEPLRIHPTMPYMVYTPAVLGDRNLIPDHPQVVRYRFLFHDGEVSPSTINRLANDFNNPLIAKKVATTLEGR